MAYAIAKIEGNKIISTSLWNTSVFEIVEKIPSNYLVWNIGENMGTDCYIPICQMLHPENKEDFSINQDTLKAVKITPEEFKKLQKAASYGVSNLKAAEKALKAKDAATCQIEKERLQLLQSTFLKELQKIKTGRQAYRGAFPRRPFNKNLRRIRKHDQD